MDYFLLAIFIYESAQKPNEKEIKEDEQTLAESNSAHCHSQAKRHLVQTSYVKLIVCQVNKHHIN